MHLKRLALVPVFAVSTFAAGIDFHDHIGMQLWSVREAMKQSEDCALGLVQITGVREVETAGTGKLTTEQFAEALKAHHLKAVGAHAGYEDLKKDAAAAISAAKAVGAEYLICPWMPPAMRPKNADDARRIAAEFNAWGEQCRAAGLKFGYHTHGFEFLPAAADSKDLVFDIIVRETKPSLVCFEMDVFWVAHAGQDPVALLNKYPDRWRLMHVKDMRKGAPTGLSTGSAPDSDSVAVGKGQLDWPSILRAAQNVGVQYYFLEDETPAPLDCIPDSLNYLRALKL
jgi:sugar phosphate isomerase/epimerase